MSRYERFRRQPTLPTALALQAIFGEPASELFAGLYEDAEQEIADRARELLAQLAQAAPTDLQGSRKLALLSRIAARKSSELTNSLRRR